MWYFEEGAQEVRQLGHRLLWTSRLCVFDFQRIWALVAACALLGTAAFILFVIHPGGFEGQIVWFFALMPGAFFGATLGNKVFQASPMLARILFLAGVFGLSFSLVFRSEPRSNKDIPSFSAHVSSLRPLSDSSTKNDSIQTVRSFLASMYLRRTALIVVW